jgi:Tfp pilus assembly protein PilZ
MEGAQPSMPPFSSPQQVPDPGRRKTLRVCFETAEGFRKEYHQNLARGVLFVPTDDLHARHETVDIVFDLEFAGKSISVCGEIVVVIDPMLAEAGGTSSGVSLRLIEDASGLRRKLEELSGISLGESAGSKVAGRRVAERSGSDADIRIETRDDRFSGVTANISYSGILALLWRATIPVGTAVRTILSSPAVELELPVDGKIIHRTRCHDGMIAHGIQLHYPVDRIEEVMSFIDFLQAFDRARRLAAISGEIDETGLGATLEMFVNTAPAGTMIVSRGEEEGKIVFSDNEILQCALGIVSGLKALSRMFRWKQGRFEFHHDLQLSGDAEAPQPLEEAMMSASVQMDEMARIDGGILGPADTFETVSEQVAALRDSLSEVESEVLDYAAEGFNVEAISDVVADSDAAVYKALSELLDAGLVRLRRG